ncbi:16S rRNA (adenine(1518)-N(6)/adenine(1519)-N(6))-dimethyltransferase RsmA [Salinispira pacifica]|uniref:16S rRNA (adenine(1518)-N(6)/adenine(1519)-N(6))- dimethyltransferase RsmA n=1 Tax=Salinispira pacifica TaxID=1307761 RepID=UPI00146FAE04|nr:16S rRNA (adenine(1518)-N(6)/adenine(1519)-N(6))-dimethyltransferase RsmA [Salinispira pacifica]
MQKRFGQNFMINPDMRKKVVDCLPPVEGREVWEIGPGIGALSRELLDRSARVTMFEIDRGFIALLKELFKADIHNGSLRIVEGDASKTLFSQPERPGMIIGNLPYNVGSGIISRLLTSGFHDLPMVFTLQKEVVERICANPGTPRYGSFSVLAQYAMECRNAGNISPGSFYPAPEVSSAILRMTPEKTSCGARELAILDAVLRTLFHNRRKTLANNIKKMGEGRRIKPANGTSPGQPPPP